MNEEVVAVFIPIVAIVMSLGIPIIYQILDYRRRRDVVEAHHKERMAAIERGMELPALPEAFYSPLDRNKRPRHLLTGMIWLAYLIYYFIEGKHEVAAFRAKEAARDAVAAKV